MIRRHLGVLATCAVYALSGWLLMAFLHPIFHALSSAATGGIGG